jgi:hypothetical protein
MYKNCKLNGTQVNYFGELSPALNMAAVTRTHVIRNGLFLVDKWDPEKEGTKQLHEINIENKMECMKRIADIANLGNEMGKLNRGKNISATQISNNDISWDANFAMLVEYVGENFRLPSRVDGPTVVNGKQKLGVWYNYESKRQSTPARGVCIQGMKVIKSILY